jgi:hypothetical protein
MRTHLIIPCIALISFFVHINVSAQTNDTQIVTSFTEKVNQLKTDIQLASKPVHTERLIDEIDTLRINFLEHKELIDYALFPNSFESVMSSLTQQNLKQHKQVLLIEHQQSKISNLTHTLDRYRNEISVLNNKTKALLEEINESEKSEVYLSGLITDYRNNLADRDALIYLLLDSMMVSYEGIQGSNDLELHGDRKNFQQDNLLETLNTIIQQNKEYVNANNSHLSTEDYLRMYTLQKKMSRVWDSIGHNVINTYAADNQNEWTKEIDQSLEDWSAIVSMKMWRSLSKYFSTNNIELGAFDDNYSFFLAINSFIDNAEADSEGFVITDDAYTDYQKFNQIWRTKVNVDWNMYIIGGEILTIAQLSSIEERLVKWDESSRPIHPFIVGLFSLTLVAIAGFAFAMIRS